MTWHSAALVNLRGMGNSNQFEGVSGLESGTAALVEKAALHGNHAAFTYGV
jgi:hypothetical protein